MWPNYFNLQLNSSTTQESNITLYLNELESIRSEEEHLPNCDWHDIIQQFMQPIYIEHIQELAFNIYKYFLTIFLRKKLIRKKDSVRAFKFYDLYTYRAKRLKIKKKIMLLLNMKKTLNNFWAWIRTHTIYYISKKAQSLRKYFFKLRDALPGFIDVARVLNFEHNLKYVPPRLRSLKGKISRSYARIKRKLNWFDEQNRYKAANDPRYREKNYNQQLQEYMKFLKKLNMQVDSYVNLKDILEYARDHMANRHLFPTQLPKIFLRSNGKFKSRLPQYFVNSFNNNLWKFIKSYYYKSNTGIRKHQNIWKLKLIEGLSAKQRMQTTAMKLRAVYLPKNTREYAEKIIRKQFVPPNLFQKLKRKFKRKRNALFRQIRMHLVLQESKKASLYSLLYTLQKAIISSNESFQGIVTRAKFRLKKQYAEYLYGLNQNYARSFEYNLSEFINNCVKLLKGYSENLTSPISTIVKAVKTKMNTTILELKRVYDTHKWSLKHIITRNQFNAKTKIILWGSAGKLGFHSNKRTTPYAAEVLGKYFSRFLNRRRLNFVNVQFTEMPRKKEREFLKGFSKLKINFLRMYYKRKIMFGSIRKPKQRRV